MSRKRPARRRPGSEELAEIRRSCLAMRVQKANRVVVRHYEEKMRRPLGVTAPQFTLLVHLWEGAGRSISFLAASLRVERTTLSRNLRVLEKQGLIALSEEGFRRQRSIALTPAGLEVLERGLPMWREAQEEMAQKLGEDWETVRGLLDRLASLE